MLSRRNKHWYLNKNWVGMLHTVFDSSLPISMVRKQRGIISVCSKKLMTSVSSTCITTKKKRKKFSLTELVFFGASKDYVSGQMKRTIHKVVTCCFCYMINWQYKNTSMQQITKLPLSCNLICLGLELVLMLNWVHCIALSRLRDYMNFHWWSYCRISKTDLFII